MDDKTVTVKKKRRVFDQHLVIVWPNVYTTELSEKQNR